MIITCPACEKKYFVDDGRMSPKGQQVRCGECTHLWWQDPVETLTLDPRKEGIVEKDRYIPPNTNPGLNKLEKSIGEEKKPRGLRAFLHNYYLDWLVILFALLIVLFVTYRERGTFFDQAPSFKRVINPHIGGNPASPSPGLVVQGIRYDVAHHNNIPHLIITGELMNISAQTMPVPPLTFTVFGKNEGQDMIPKSHSWQHANKNERLLPGGRLPFQSITTHPGWSTIEKIDASY